SHARFQASSEDAPQGCLQASCSARSTIDHIRRALSAASNFNSLLGSTRHVTGMSRHRPLQSQFGDVAQNIIALGHRAPFNPRHEILKRAIAYSTIDPAMPCPTHGALHQKMRRARCLGTTAIVLFKTEWCPKIASF